MYASRIRMYTMRMTILYDNDHQLLDQK